MSTDAELLTNITAITRRTPSLLDSPGLVFGAASSSDPLRTAETIAGMREAVFTMHRLKRMDEDHQVSAYSNMDEGLRSRIEAAGYVPPHRKPENSWWRQYLGRPLGYVVGGTLGNAVEFANKGFSGGIGTVRHLYRAMEWMEIEEARRNGELEKGLKNQTSYWGFKGFRNAWQDTADGDHFIPHPRAFLDAHDVALPEEFTDVAADAARGFTQADLMSVYGDQAVRAIQDPTFSGAVQALQAAKLSFGRRVALGFGGDPDGPVFKKVSGLLDAAVDFTADPFNLVPIGKIRQVRANALKTGSGGLAEAEMIYKHFPENRRAVDTIANIFSQAGTDPETGLAQVGGKLRATFGEKFSPLIDDLVQANPKTPGEVLDYFGGLNSVAAISEGKAGRYYTKHLTLGRSREIWNRVKGADDLGGYASLMDKTGIPEYKAVAKLTRHMRRISNKTPAQRTFRPDSIEAFETVRQVAQMALPGQRTKDILDAWSASDIGGKYQIWRSMRDEMASALGVLDDPDLKKVWDRFGEAATQSELGVGQSFGVSRFDTALGALPDGKNFGGIWEHQLQGNWVVPDYNALANAMKATNTLRRVIGRGHIPENLINDFMNKVWRPGKVATPIQGVRQGLEEIGGYAAEKGLFPTLRARLGASAVKRLNKVPEAKRGLVSSMAGMFKDTLARSAVKMSDDDLVRYTEEILDDVGEIALPKSINPANPNVLDEPYEITKLLTSNDQPVRIRLQPGGRYTKYQHFDSAQPLAWQMRLSEKVNSPMLKVLTETVDNGEPAMEAALRAYLVSDRAKVLRSSSAFYKAWKSSVGETEAVAKWAKEVTEDFLNLTHGQAGRIDEVLEPLKQGKVPDLEVLRDLPMERRPMTLTAREFVPVGKGQKLSERVQQGIFGLMDRQIGWVSRQPMFVAEYARARKELTPQLLKWQKAGVKDAERLIKQRARDIAAREVYEHVDDPAVKSQFARAHTALFPFWNAYDQFVRRWGRRALRDPKSIRRVQLTAQGIEHSGFTERDQNGDLIFHYPAVGFAFKPLLAGLGLITGNPVYASLPVNFTGRVKYVVPGADDPLRPGFGPILTIPVKALQDRLPEFSIDAFNEVVGERRFSSPLWEQLAPTTIVKALKPFITPEGDDGMLSSVNNAIQYLEATGKGLPEQATPEQQEEYIDNVRQWARSMLLLRGMFSLTVPGAPSIEYENNLNPELRALMSARPFNEAIEQFLKLHPDADAYTVFQSRTTEGAAKPLPATKVAQSWIEENQGLVDKYGAAATWFMPPPRDDYDPQVWRDQLAQGLRQRLKGKEYWAEQKIAVAANEYFARRDDYHKRAASLTGPSRDLLDLQWRDWSARFKLSHPLFERHLASSPEREVIRGQVLGRIYEASQEFNVPEITELLDAYRTFRTTYDSLYGRRDALARAQRDVYTSRMLTYGDSLTDERAKSLFNSYIRPDLPEI